MIWFSTLFCVTLGLTASGKSFFKKKKPEPETSTPIREDQTTSIRDKKPDLDSSDDGKKMASPAERRTKNKREVSTSVQDWGGRGLGVDQHIGFGNLKNYLQYREVMECWKGGVNHYMMLSDLMFWYECSIKFWVSWNLVTFEDYIQLFYLHDMLDICRDWTIYNFTTIHNLLKYICIGYY